MYWSTWHYHVKDIAGAPVSKKCSNINEHFYSPKKQQDRQKYRLYTVDKTCTFTIWTHNRKTWFSNAVHTPLIASDVEQNNVYSIRPPVQIGVRPQLLSTEHDRRHRKCCQLLQTARDARNLLLTIIVGCVDNTCGVTPKMNKRRASAAYAVVQCPSALCSSVCDARVL